MTEMKTWTWGDIMRNMATKGEYFVIIEEREEEE